jgi:hypothetical protein
LEPHQTLGPTVRFTLSQGQRQVRLPAPTQPFSPQSRSLIMLILYCRIIDLLVQLFWKQNRYLNNNSRYNGKSTDSRSRGGSTDQSTPARESHEKCATSPSTTSFPAQKRKNENKMFVSLSSAIFAAAKTNHSILGPQRPQGQRKSRRHLQ